MSSGSTCGAPPNKSSGVDVHSNIRSTSSGSTSAISSAFRAASAASPVILSLPAVDSVIFQPTYGALYAWISCATRILGKMFPCLTCGKMDRAINKSLWVIFRMVRVRFTSKHYLPNLYSSK